MTASSQAALLFGASESQRILSVPRSQRRLRPARNPHQPRHHRHPRGQRHDRQGGLDRAEAEANQLINRLGTAEEITQAVPWLRSPGAGFVIGVALPVDGGYIAR